MTAHDAEYFRQRRRHLGIPPRDPLLAPRLLQRGAELRRLEQLPWPRNLFGENATIAELMAEAAQVGPGAWNLNDRCMCGCRKEHKHRVSQTTRNPYGRDYDVLYFSSEACKNKWNRASVNRESGGHDPAMVAPAQSGGANQ